MACLTGEAPRTVRELIMELRKVGNHDAPVLLAFGEGRKFFISKVQFTGQREQCVLVMRKTKPRRDDDDGLASPPIRAPDPDIET